MVDLCMRPWPFPLSRAGTCQPGSFGSPSSYRFDGGGTMFRKVLETFDNLVPKAPHKCQHGTAERGKNLRRVAGDRECPVSRCN